MSKVFKWLADQFIVQVVLNLLVYMLYWTIIGAALTPAMPYRELVRLTRFSKDEKRTHAMPTGERNTDGISE
jgi:hypothetical protein